MSNYSVDIQYISKCKKFTLEYESSKLFTNYIEILTKAFAQVVITENELAYLRINVEGPNGTTTHSCTFSNGESGVIIGQTMQERHDCATDNFFILHGFDNSIVEYSFCAFNGMTANDLAAVFKTLYKLEVCEYMHIPSWRRYFEYTNPVAVLKLDYILGDKFTDAMTAYDDTNVSHEVFKWNEHTCSIEIDDKYFSKLSLDKCVEDYVNNKWSLTKDEYGYTLYKNAKMINQTLALSILGKVVHSTNACFPKGTTFDKIIQPFSIPGCTIYWIVRIGFDVYKCTL